MKYDFHVHSYFSDSNIPFEQNVNIALNKGIDYLGIVDHDTLDSVKLAKAPKYKSLGMTVIGGIEISCYDFDNNNSVHIVGYGCDTNNDKLNNLISTTQKRRNEQLINNFSIINSKGLVHIDLDEVKALLINNTIYKPQIINYLISKGYDVSSQSEVYNHFYGKNGYIKTNIEYPKYEDAIDTIRQSGGIPVLAHPFVYDNFSNINDFLDAGIMGIESRHPSSDLERENLLLSYCLHNKLLVTCGSDFHGDYGMRGAEIGDCSLSDEHMEPFIDALKSRGFYKD